MIITATAKRYAKALYDLALEKGCIDEILNNFSSLFSLIEANKAFETALQTHDQRLRKKIISDFSHNFSSLFITFVSIVLKNNRYKLLQQIHEDFRSRNDELNNRVRVVAITAVPVTGEVLDQLTGNLSNYLGKNVIIENKVNSEILGGIIIYVNSKILNASISEQFRQMKHYLTNN